MLMGNNKLKYRSKHRNKLIDDAGKLFKSSGNDPKKEINQHYIKKIGLKDVSYLFYLEKILYSFVETASDLNGSPI